ncbi:unnamed protein product [Musa acuminata subsp. burmannicoides]
MDQHKGVGAKEEEDREEKKTVPEITLRPFTLSDVDDFMTWATDDRVMRFSRRPTCTTKDECLTRMKDLIMPHPWCRAICIDDDGRPVGLVSVMPAPGADVHRASIGFAIAYDYWGHGIATAAVKKAASAVFEEWPFLERLDAIAEVNNTASRRVLEKAGFQREAVLRSYLALRGESKDMVMYSGEMNLLDSENNSRWMPGK